MTIGLSFLAVPGFLGAESLRIATYAAPLSRDGPGLLLRDILGGADPQIEAVALVLAGMAADIVVLTDFDWDQDLVALRSFADLLRERSVNYTHIFSLPPNSVLSTGLDMDGNGWLGEARDRQGYGRFAGDNGMAILSRWPIAAAGVRDFSDILWQDLPGATLPIWPDGTAFPSEAAASVQRLSSSGHWVVPIQLPDGAELSLLVWAATPPVFDGSEDRNGLRNRDELLVWQHLLDGGMGPVPDPFILIGNANLDPADGDGLRPAMMNLLADARLVDPLPQSEGAIIAADANHLGDPGLDTADWTGDGAGPGNLRVSYILPDAALDVVGAGVFWPASDDPLADLLAPNGLAAGPHHLVWVDIGR